MSNKLRRRRNIQKKVKEYLYENGETNIRDLAFFINEKTIYHTSPIGIGVILRQCLAHGEIIKTIKGRHSLYRLSPNEIKIMEVFG